MLMLLCMLMLMLTSITNGDVEVDADADVKVNVDDDDDDNVCFPSQSVEARREACSAPTSSAAGNIFTSCHFCGMPPCKTSACRAPFYGS